MPLGLSLTAEDHADMSHVSSMAQFALKMLEKLRDINTDLHTNYRMKIGQYSLDEQCQTECKMPL